MPIVIKKSPKEKKFKKQPVTIGDPVETTEEEEEAR